MNKSRQNMNVLLSTIKMSQIIITCMLTLSYSLSSLFGWLFATLYNIPRSRAFGKVRTTGWFILSFVALLALGFPSACLYLVLVVYDWGLTGGVGYFVCSAMTSFCAHVYAMQRESDRRWNATNSEENVGAKMPWMDLPPRKPLDVMPSPVQSRFMCCRKTKYV